MIDMLQTMLEIQKEIQLKCYPNVQTLPREEQMLINTRAMIHETCEVENELNWKHWKKPADIDFDHKVKEEIVDQFIFLMNLINISDMDASELYDRTLNKIDVNIQRQLTGY